MDEDRAEHEQPEPPPSVVPPVGVPEQADHGIEQDGADHEQQGAHDDGNKRAGLAAFLKGSDTPNWVMVLLTVVITAGTIGQCRSARESNRITLEGIHRSLEEARLASDDALRINAHILGMMADQNRLAAEATAKGSEQAEADRIQSEAGAAVEQGLTRQTIADSRRSFEIASRARLAMAGDSDVQLQAGVPFVAWVHITNTGLVPASNVRTSSTMVMRDKPLPADAARKISVYEHVMDVGAGLGLQVSNIFPALDRQTVESIANGPTYLYLYGRVKYNDGFGKERTLGFCVQYKLTEWKLCPDNNWAD